MYYIILGIQKIKTVENFGVKPQYRVRTDEKLNSQFDRRGIGNLQKRLYGRLFFEKDPSGVSDTYKLSFVKSLPTTYAPCFSYRCPLLLITSLRGDRK